MFLLLALIGMLSGPAQAGTWEQATQAVKEQASAGFCGGEGARCVTNLDCCRGSCQRQICRSGFISPVPCKVNGSSCSRGSDCCSGICLGRCQPRIEP